MRPLQRASVIIVNYATDDHVRQLLDDLASQLYVALSVVVVNTGPSSLRLADESWDGGSLSSLAIYTTPGNLGYMGAVQWTLDNNLVHTSQPIIVSNADIRVPDVFAMSELLSIQGSTCVAPQVVDPDGRLRNPYHRKRPSTWRLLVSLLIFSTFRGYLAWQKLRQDRPRLTSHDGIRRVKIWAPYGAFLVLFPTFFQRGGHIPRTFLFGEEELLGDEIQRVGGVVTLLASVRVEHTGQVSTGLPSRNRWRLQRRAVASVLCRRLRSGFPEAAAVERGAPRC